MNATQHIERFLDECTVMEPGAARATVELHCIYQAWAESEGLAPLGEVAFGLVVQRVRPDWTTKAGAVETRAWRGVALRPEGPRPNSPEDVGFPRVQKRAKAEKARR